MAKENTLLIEFSRFAGELAESLGFNKSIGQIYGLLYLSPDPLALEDIAKKLSMSKGNASVNLRILDDWGAVHFSSVHGSRRDFYEANRDIKVIATRRLQEGLSRRLDRAEEMLTRLLIDSENRPKDPHAPTMLRKISELRSMVVRGRKSLHVMPKFLRLLDWA